MWANRPFTYLFFMKWKKSPQNTWIRIGCLASVLQVSLPPLLRMFESRETCAII